MTGVEAGTPFGHYRLRRLLGEGGMGQVYEAYDTRSDRIVALKVLPPHSAADPGFRERFRRESRAAAGLNDPHVIPIHQYGEIDGRMYLDMRLVEGEGVDAVIARRSPMSPVAAVSIVSQVAAALTAAHAQGLVHRDVKPSNMLLCANDFVYLIDFGIARSAAEAGLTSTGAAIGTFAYMSPERLGGVADARSDVYALACVLYECLTGTQPFPGVSLEQQITAHLTSPPPRPSLVRPEVPAAFDEVIARGMAKTVTERYQTADELAAAAHHALLGSTGVTAAKIDSKRTAPTVLAMMSQPSITWQEPETVHVQYVPNPPSTSMRTDRAGAPPDSKNFRRAGVALVAAVVIALAGVGSWYATRPAQPTSSTKAPAVPTFKVGGDYPERLAVDAATHTAYVTNNTSESVWVFDTISRTVTTTMKVGQPGISGMTLDPDTHTLYTIGDRLVWVIDTASRTATSIEAVAPGNWPLRGIALDSDRHTLYVTNGLAMVAIDTVSRTVLSSFTVGDYPSQLALDTNTQTLWAVNEKAGTISIIDPASRRVSATVKVGNSPRQLALDSATRTAYVTNWDDGTVSVIDMESHSVTSTIRVSQGTGASGIALDPVAHTIYVTDGGQKLSMIDSASHAITATVVVGDAPCAAAVDPVTHTVYVINNRGGSISVIER